MPALTRGASEVQPITATGALIRNFLVWSDQAPSVKANPDQVYAKCLALPGSTAKQLKLRQVYPAGFESDEFTVPTSKCLNANEETMDPLALRDIGLCQHQNRAAVLDFLRQRFMKNSIYTTADPLLVAINPFQNVGLTTEAFVTKYRDSQNVATLPPHVFSIARQAQDNLLHIGTSQTIIVTGESGAGKTEATKHCMQFFASAKGVIDTSIQKAVMAANPVLEAFGNAKTIRNNNSSRFGRFMRLYLGKKGGICNGLVQGFLLEKVRVTSQQPNERSYHIFYQFIKGARPEERKKFDLLRLQDYRNLNERSGGCYDADNIDDLEEFSDVRKAFKSMQLTDEEITTVFSIVSGVLRLGNVSFVGKNIQGQDNAAEIDENGRESLKSACRLLFLDHDYPKVAEGLVSTTKMIGREEVTTRVQKNEAYGLCSSLGKAMYDGLFKWIISRLNETIKPSATDLASASFMGMLDIFGFEIFEDNSLEQLLINITNEFLQKNFVDIVFEKESKLYRDEGVSTAELVFTDNREVINCLIARRGSVFALLEDTCVQKGSDQKFHQAMNAQLKGKNDCYGVPPGGEKDLSFLIKHTIASIKYSAKDFTSKNMDILKFELTEVAQSSHNEIVRAMFADVKMEKGKLPKTQLIASKFLVQLNEMMDLILSTESHFIRCVKPNETKRPKDWNNAKVLNQLFSLSILEALQLKKLGFSWRRSFADFIRIFKNLQPHLHSQLELLDDPKSSNRSQSPSRDSVRAQRELAIQMLHNIASRFAEIHKPFQEKTHYQIGRTMVFLKPETSQEIMMMVHQAMEEYSPAVSLIEALYSRQMLKRDVQQMAPALVRVQSHVRKVLYNKGYKIQPTCARPVVAANVMPPRITTRF